MFNNMDTDKSGTITVQELKAGLTKLGSKISEAEVQKLGEATPRGGPLVLLHLDKPHLGAGLQVV